LVRQAYYVSLIDCKQGSFLKGEIKMETGRELYKAMNCQTEEAEYMARYVDMNLREVLKICKPIMENIEDYDGSSAEWNNFENMVKELEEKLKREKKK
jgi:hypothetical protein